MAAFTDSLRGYAFPVHMRDGFKCAYCGLDGTRSFEAWLSLSQDHLLPNGHPLRDQHEYIVTACQFCNGTDNWYFKRAAERGITFDARTREELVAQRKPYVLKTRKSYREFWEAEVRPQQSGSTGTRL